MSSRMVSTISYAMTNLVNQESSASVIQKSSASLIQESSSSPHPDVVCPLQLLADFLTPLLVVGTIHSRCCCVPHNGYQTNGTTDEDRFFYSSQMVPNGYNGYKWLKMVTKWLSNWLYKYGW